MVEFYGVGVGGDTLANTTIGGSYVSKSFMRFRAPYSSALNGFRVYYLGAEESSGYAGGTGGVKQFRIHTDDGTANHYPTSTVLATQNHPATYDSDAGLYVAFASPPTLTAGVLYHLVCENIDSNPGANYFSLDYLWSISHGAQWHPRFPNTDWAHGYWDDAKWVTRTAYAPILELDFTAGHYGMGYMEVSLADPGRIEGSNYKVRELFTVTGGTRTVSRVGVRVIRDTGTADLVLTLRNSGGTAIATANIPASSIVQGDWEYPTSGEDAVYASAAMDATLTNGSTYSLELSTASGTTYYAFVLRQGSAATYDYDPATYFGDGVCQETTNGGSSWSGFGNVPAQSDLQFYFEVGEAEPPPATGAAEHVQSLGSATVGNVASTSLSISTSKTLTAGNLVAVGVGLYYDVTPTAVTDNLGNVYSLVERTRRSEATACFYYAPVTVGGALTTITVTFASTTYVSVVADEFSGLSGSPVAAGGLTGVGQTITWKAAAGVIGPDGAVIGVAVNEFAATHAAGAASGTPSVAIVLGQSLSSDPSISIGYTLGADESVSDFVGTTTTTYSSDWAGAGGIFTAKATNAASLALTGHGTITTAGRHARPEAQSLTGAGTVVFTYAVFIAGMAKQGVLVAGGGGTIAVSSSIARTVVITGVTGAGSVVVAAGAHNRRTSLSAMGGGIIVISTDKARFGQTSLTGAGTVMLNNQVAVPPMVTPLGGIGWGGVGAKKKRKRSVLIRAIVMEVEQQSAGGPLAVDVRHLTATQIEGINALLGLLDKHRD